MRREILDADIDNNIGSRKSLKFLLLARVNGCTGRQEMIARPHVDWLIADAKIG